MSLELNTITPKTRLESGRRSRRLILLFLAVFFLNGVGAVTSASAENGKIAYAAGNAIFKMNPDGTGVEQLTFNFGYDMDYSPVWSPDGTKLAFARIVSEPVLNPQGNDSITYDTTYNIYTIDYDGGNLTRIKTGSTFVNDLTWSPDGTKLAYVQGADSTYAGRLQNCAGNSYIYLVDAVANGASKRIGEATGGVDPSWSPDGEKIYFAVNSNSEDYGIYSVNPDTHETERLTYDSVPPADPEISPDGTKIAYAVNYNEDQCFMGNMSTMGPTRLHIYRGNIVVYDILQGGTTIVAVGGASSPSWNPGGNLLLFVTSNGFEAEGPQLSTIALDGTNQTVIPNGGGGETSGSWSP